KALEALLASLVDDAHAPLADLFQQLVIADHLISCWGGFLKSARLGPGAEAAQRLRFIRGLPAQTLPLLASGEVRPQFFSQFGVPGQELLPLHGFPPILAL